MIKLKKMGYGGIMNKKFISLLTALMLLFTLLPEIKIGAASQYETQVTLGNVSSSEWMKAIRGETRLTEITIPGTHDSCARKFNNDWLVSSTAKCQSLNITEQLNAGIRFLDIRCEVDSSTYSVKTVHGSADCWDGDDYYYLDFVFQHIFTWLDTHPSETVLVSIKEDDGDAGAAVFTSAIYEYIHGYGQSKYFYGESYNYHDYWYLGKSVPTLDEVRGKCVLMNRFDQIIASSGSTASEEESGQKIKWGDYSDGTYSSPVYANVTNTNSGVGTFHVQDHYKWNTDSKKLATQEMLSLGHYRGEYYFNFSSTVSDSTIPNPSNLAEKVNAGYAGFTYNKTKPSGIFAMDFATEELARYIILNNEAVSTVVEGTDGNISYTLNRLTGELSLSGSGAMNNYAYTSQNGSNGMGSTAPWGDQIKNSLFDGQYNSDIITKITVGDGITSIGNYAFYGYDHVTEVILPDSITSIGEGAFAKCSSLSEINIHHTPTNSIGVYAFKDCTNLSKFCTSPSVESIADNAFTNTPKLVMYGEDGIYSKSFADSKSIPYVVTDFSDYYVNAKAGNTAKESENPFKGKDLTKGVTISFSKLCNTDNGWNTSLISFSTGKNTDNRYFIIMANGTILFNDGNGGVGGWNNCYFDINTSSPVNTTSSEWVDIDITVDKDASGRHILCYYVNRQLAKEYILNDICASGYPYGYSGDDGIFSFLGSEDINLYYGASFSIYPTMAGTADCYLDRAEFLTYAKPESEIEEKTAYSYLNTFTESLGGTAVTGWEDSGKTVMLDTNDNDGRTGTAYFPYTQNGGQYSNYIATNTNPVVNADTSKGLTVSFWQRINGNYYGNLESVTFAKGDLDAKKYFCIGTDGYIRYNNGNGGSDSALTSAGLYFDYTEADSNITNKVWQFITVEIIDDYHIDIYINGELSKQITVTGTESYQSSGGLLEFLTDADTKLYLGGYTAYWGTCTLSLDNVYCFNKALKPSEVYCLYANEKGITQSGFINEFNSTPALYSGAIELCKVKNSKNGVLYIPEGSCNSDVTMYCDSVQLGDNQTVESGKSVTVNYTGNKSVKGWLVVGESGEIILTGGACDSFTFNITENSYILCQLKNSAANDFSAFNEAYNSALLIDGNLYTDESYQSVNELLITYSDFADTQPTQIEVDNAAQEILEAVALLEEAENIIYGTVSSGYSENDIITLGLYTDGSDEAEYEMTLSGNNTKYYLKNIAGGTYTLKATKNNHLTFTETVTVNGDAQIFDFRIRQLGDVTMNGTVDIEDIEMILSASSSETALSEIQTALADIDLSERVDAFDAAAVDRLAEYSDILIGDVNLDGAVDLSDYAMIKSHLTDDINGNLLKTDNLDLRYSELIPLYESGTIITQQYYSADLNSDRAVDAFDLFLLDKRLNNLV